MLVAAHNGDLAAAAATGFRTAFVTRPTEHGPHQTTDLEPTGRWDVVVDDLRQLADALAGTASAAARRGAGASRRS
jgi:2-haloacid dehalogenase